MVPLILEEIHKLHHVNISPIARKRQLEYNARARNQGKSSFNKVVSYHVSQVLYSVVAYPVGSHKDVTVKGVAQELIECKGRLTWPKMCTYDRNGPPLGRGGAGRGIFTVMIVDHPKGQHKSTKKQSMDVQHMESSGASSRAMASLRDNLVKAVK
jgi:hypothetical protein